jgi:hypothetical protein
MQNKFKVGDRVRTVTSSPWWVVGATGTIEGRDGTIFLVRFDKGEGDTSWWTDAADMELLTPTVKTPSVADDLRLTPQAKTVLRHLKTRGNVSPAEALIVYGISRLASCIHEIRRKANYNVNCEIRRDAQGHKYANYSLVVPALVH